MLPIVCLLNFLFDCHFLLNQFFSTLILLLSILGPSDLKYSPSHEWTRVEGNVGTVGISADAVSKLGDVVYVELPKVGDVFEKGSTFGYVESVKATSDVYAPFSGEVLEVNQAAVDDPSIINSDPFGEGWFAKISIKTPSEVDELLNATQYGEICEE